MELQLPTVLIEIEGGVAEISHDLPFNVVLIDYDTIEENDIEGTFDVLSARVAATRIKERMANAVAPEFVAHDGLFLPNWDNIGQMISRIRGAALEFIHAALYANGGEIQLPEGFYVTPQDWGRIVFAYGIKGGGDWVDMSTFQIVELAGLVEKAIAG